MSDKPLITDTNVILTKPVPWAVYDEFNTILVKKGEVIYTKTQLQLLQQRKAYYLVTEKLPEQEEANIEEVNFAAQNSLQRTFVNPFQHIDDLSTDLSMCFLAISKKQKRADELLTHCSHMVEELCIKDPDAAIGAIHLYRKHKNNVSKPIYAAILGNIIATRLRYDPTHKLTVVKALLVCNIASVSYQDQLDKQSTPLTNEQFHKIRKHPEEGVVMLHNAGIDDKHLLQIVLQHHERSDGSGYPRKLHDEQIDIDAKLAALVEYYTAVISNRTYRMAKQAKEALREVYHKAKGAEAQLHLTFIKELGVYPPGTYVKLANGEIALVIKRQPFSVAPLVKAVIDAKGNPYSEVLARDCTLKDFHIAENHHLETSLNYSFPDLWDY